MYYYLLYGLVLGNPGAPGRLGACARIARRRDTVHYEYMALAKHAYVIIV